MSATRRIDKLSEAFALAASGDVPASVRFRSVAPSPGKPIPTISANTPYMVMEMDRDTGATLFGGNAAQLVKSIDDGVTWVNVGAPFATGIVGVRLLKDGQLLVSTSLVTGVTAGKVYKSSGYPAAPIFTLVLTCNNPGAYIPGEWGMPPAPNLTGGIVVLCEYGNKNPPNDIASRVYLSKDFAATFATIFTLTQSSGAHMHGAVYDPYWDRIWRANGDAAFGGISYSDDLGVTWTALSSGIALQPNSLAPGQPHPVGILPLPDCILFSTDDLTNGLWVVWRRRKEDKPYLQRLLSLEQADLVQVIGGMHFWRGEGYEALFPFIRAINGPGYLVATRGGADAHVLWKDQAAYNTPDGLVTMVGPTASGKYVGSRRIGADYQTVTFTAPQWIQVSEAAPQRKIARYLRLTPTGTTSYAYCPDSPALSFTADFDLRARVSLVDWTPAANMVIASQFSASQRFYLQVLVAGTLQLFWWDSGGTLRGATSSVAPTVADGDALSVRVIVDVDNGAGGCDVKFYTSSGTEPTDAWTQLGTTVTQAFTTSIRDTADVLAVGAISTGTGARLDGKLHWMQLRSGIDGTIVANPDWRSGQWKVGDTATAANVPTGPDGAGNTWTLGGTGARIESDAVFDSAAYVNVPTLPAAATDAATTQTLANAMRKALLNMEAMK